MAKYRITAPDGHTYLVEGEGTQEEALAAFQQQYAAEKQAALDPSSTVRQEKPTFLESVGRGAMDVAQGIKQAILPGKPSGPVLPSIQELRAYAGPEDQGLTDAQLQAKYAQTDPSADYTKQVNDEIGLYEKGRGPNAGFDAGRLTGNVAATAPLALVPGGAGAGLGARVASGAVQGALAGASQFDPTNDSQGLNTLVGGAVGAALPVAGKAVGAVLGPAKNAMKAGANKLVDLAKQYGIPLDAAQATGRRALEHLKEATSAFPGSGAEAFDRAQRDAYNKALASTFGQDLPDGQFSKAIMDQAAKRLGQGFETVAAGKPVDITPKMQQVLRQIEAGNDPANRLTYSPEIEQMVADARSQFAGKAKMSGEEAQQLRSALTEQKNDLARQGKPKRVTDAMRDIRDAVDESIEASLSPDELKAWKQAQAQYGNFKTVSQALANSSGDTGDISGVQLWNAIKNQVGRKNMARAGGDLKDLASLGKDVLKQKQANTSKTAHTLLYQGLLGGAGAAVGAHEGGAEGAGLGTVGALLTAPLVSRGLRSQMIANLLREGMLPQSPEAAQLANVLRRYGATPVGVAETTGPQ